VAGRAHFARSNARVEGSNPTQGMQFCVRSFRVCVVLRVGSGLATGPTDCVQDQETEKRDQGPTKDCRTIDR
jgi:hypothetical protein